MSTVTIRAINDAIATTLGTATGMKVTHSYDELKEGIGPGDMPLLQVYFESIDCDKDVETERTTFQGKVRTKTLTYHADIYCRTRSHIGEDMAKTLEMTDEVVDIFETLDIKEYFDLEGIKAFDWRADRVVFNYADAQYMGVRFVITITVF